MRQWPQDHMTLLKLLCPCHQGLCSPQLKGRAISFINFSDTSLKAIDDMIVVRSGGIVHILTEVTSRDPDLVETVVWSDTDINQPNFTVKWTVLRIFLKEMLQSGKPLGRLLK